MRYAKKYDVYADKILLGSVTNISKPKDFYSDWRYSGNPEHVVSVYGVNSFGEAVETCIADHDFVDETFEIRLVPVHQQG